MGRTVKHGEYEPTRREIERWKVRLRKEREEKEHRNHTEAIRGLVAEHAVDCECVMCLTDVVDNLSSDMEDE